MILVIGRSGQVARALRRRAETRGMEINTIGRPDIDLECPESVTGFITAHSARAVINVAAYTAVDKAEAEPERALRVNAAGAEAVARAAADIGAPVIQVSTDYVFSGSKTTPYVESDPTGPRCAYGVSKLEGERAVVAANPLSIIVRTAWVFDATGANFLRTMLRLGKGRSEVTVVSDQLGCPTYADDLADVLLTVADAPQCSATYHCAGQGETSWADFARAIFAEAAARGGRTASVKDILTSDYPTAAQRPSNSRLDCSKLAVAYGIRMRSWRSALSDCMNEIEAGGWRV